jgi:hypothetical protein
MTVFADPVVDGGALLDLIWVSLLAGVGVVILFSLVILGGSRSADARRQGRGGAAAAFLSVSSIALIAFFAVLVVGVKLLVG